MPKSQKPRTYTGWQLVNGADVWPLDMVDMGKVYWMFTGTGNWKVVFK
jgi:hypothetical protein